MQKKTTNGQSGGAATEVAQVSQPAVSPISNRQGVECTVRTNIPAGRRLEALRYSRLGNLRYGTIRSGKGQIK
jgi:hypothetical protein